VVELLVCIDVEELEHGIEFYTRGLGLALGPRHGAGWVELTGARVPVMLIASPAGDLTAAVARARAAGATQEGDIEVRPWNSIAYMADPWGNGFDLIQLPPSV
jgi:uncharacterized glyoxalase superfamily protein PhnB